MWDYKIGKSLKAGAVAEVRGFSIWKYCFVRLLYRAAELGLGLRLRSQGRSCRGRGCPRVPWPGEHRRRTAVTRGQPGLKSQHCYSVTAPGKEKGGGKKSWKNARKRTLRSRLLKGLSLVKRRANNHAAAGPQESQFLRGAQLKVSSHSLNVRMCPCTARKGSSFPLEIWFESQRLVPCDGLAVLVARALVPSGWMFNSSTRSMGACLGIVTGWHLLGAVSSGRGWGLMPEWDALVKSLPEIRTGWLEIPGSVSAFGKVCNGRASLQRVIITQSKVVLLSVRVQGELLAPLSPFFFYYFFSP